MVCFALNRFLVLKSIPGYRIMACGYRFINATFAWCTALGSNIFLVTWNRRQVWRTLRQALDDGKGSPVCWFDDSKLRANGLNVGIPKSHPRITSVPGVPSRYSLRIGCLASDDNHEVDHTINYYDATACVSFAYVALEWSNEVPKVSGYEFGFKKAGSSTYIQYNGMPS